MTDQALRDYVVIAEVDRPRGLAGEVVATLHADDPSRLDTLGLVIVAGGGGVRETRIEGWKRNGDRVVLKLSGVDTVEDARAIVGSEIRIPRLDAQQAPPPGRYFAYQLEGLEVVNVAGELLGRVVRVSRPAGQTLLEVEGERGVFLLPLVKAICTEVDVKNGRLVVDPPEGLIELNAV